MIAKFAHTLQELIFPRYCLLCRRNISSANTKDLVCHSCFESITLNTPPFCQKCGRRIKGNYTTKNICRDCRQRHYDFDRAWASCSYEGNIREMIHNFKYKHKLLLKDPLAKLIINFAKSYHLPIDYCDYITPVPLSRSKLREREFNQAEVLAEGVASGLGIPLLRDNLLRIRDTKPQADLDKDSRLNNVQGAFRVKEPLAVRNKVLLLLDDVFTTGATASEAARALKCAGAGVVFVITLAN